MRPISLIFCFFLAGLTVFAAKRETIQVPSAVMNKHVEVIVITPDVMDEPLPVVYLLHGFGGDSRDWVNQKPNLPELADEKGIIIVCPDGKRSWYWDSPKDPSVRYETFISSELISYIDANYPTIRDRKGRAISGLSMGGHGALWNAWRHKDVFGAAGSTSGGVDIRPFPKNWEMFKQLGELDSNREVWDKHTVINLVETLINGEQALIIDCGYEDFFFDVNNALHDKLMKYKIDHDYIVRPGGHNGRYWNNSIDYQLLFFRKYFDNGSE